MNNQHCVIYVRLSSRKQEETSSSLDVQEKLLVKYAKKQGFTVKKIFRDAKSKNREQATRVFSEMLHYAKREKVSHIICEKIDSLSNNPGNILAIDKWSTDSQKRNVHFVKDAFVLSKNVRTAESFIWKIRVVTARYYKESLTEEIERESISLKAGYSL